MYLVNLLFLLMIVHSQSFMLSMSSTSELYLQSLCTRQPAVSTQAMAMLSCDNIINSKNFTKDIMEFDTMLFNMQKVESVFFNRNAKNIMFNLRNNTKNIYIYEDGVSQRLTDNTKIFSKAFRNFLFYPMKKDVDAIIYKEFPFNSDKE